MKDTQEELDRLEQELIAEETQQPEDIDLDEELLTEVIEEFSQPAFEDPDKIREPAEGVVYSNYANDYGEDLQRLADTGETEPKKKNDKVIIGLMITASVLCLGIIAILLYWLNAFLI